jgi:hypothetical protein
MVLSHLVTDSLCEANGMRFGEGHEGRMDRSPRRVH